MSVLNIFSDSPLSGPAARLLEEGVAPHRVIFAKNASASVLAQAGPDPAFAEADIAFGQPDLAAIRQSSRLRWVHLSSAGFTRYDSAEFRHYAQERDLPVTNSSAVYAAPCAEHVFAFMLAQCRRLPEGLQSRAPNGAPEWFHLRNTSTSLHGKKAVILGYGSIAEQLVRLLAPFDMKLTAMRRTARGGEGIPVVTSEHLAPVLAEADHVINVLPDNAASVKFIDTEKLNGMKSGAVFYNIGRGTTVDQPALAEALHSGRLAAAWLDVTDPEPLPDGHPLLSAPNCYITPHTAGGQHLEAEALVQHFLGNFQRYLRGEMLHDRVI